MSLQLPRRAAGRRGLPRLLTLPALLGIGLVLLAGCSSASQDEWKRLAMPDPATLEGESTLALWQGAWIAALVTGVVVWGLMAWVVIRYRRRSDDEIPVQTRYNLPLEIFYTIAPVMMVVVFFSHTVRVQNIALEESACPDNIVEVTGQQWSWTFNYGLGEKDCDFKEGEGEDESGTEGYAYPSYTYEVGTASYIPTLYLPVNESTRFNLHSPDVIHDFGVPGFLMKMDVIPGRVNSYEITPTRTGSFLGKCYELCGVYHSRMLFKVEVVTAEEYADYLDTLVADDRESDEPLLGGANAITQAGLDDPAESEGESE